MEPVVRKLDHISLADPDLDVQTLSVDLYDLLWGLEAIVTPGGNWVATTKAAHHLLPELVVPVDGTFTAGFFGLSGLPKMSLDNIALYFGRFRDIALRANASALVQAGTWNSSLGKVINNAIIGYWKFFLEPLQVATIQQTLRDFAAVREWEQFHTPKNLSMALAGEVGELVEIFQWLDGDESAALSAEDEERASEEIVRRRV